MTDQLTIGVIGHVDHGKTTLVKVLTGMETDRLKEEKERGLSIVLGFAHIKTSDGIIDVIDVPGHEDFVRTMISGVSGIDAALIVVAANERIMPQTTEHIRIVSLLGIDQGVVAITKADLVSEDELIAAKEEIENHLRTTPFAGSSLVPVSAETGIGLEGLKSELNALFALRPPRPQTDQFYLPFDRVFSMKGHGTVATGTLNTGTLRVGSTGTIAPDDRRARIRGLEVHGQSVDLASAGQRVAVNFRVDGTGQIKRGDTLLSADWLQPSTFWDGTLHLLNDAPKPLKSGEKLRILHGTTEEIVALRLLDRDRLIPGETANVQFRLPKPALAWHRERFIVRSITPVTTIGGGQFTDTQSRRRSRTNAASTLVDTSPAGQQLTTLRAMLETAAFEGISKAALCERIGISGTELAALLMEANGFAANDEICFSQKVLNSLEEKLLRTLATYHAHHPAKIGMPKKEFVSTAQAPAPTVDLVLARLVERQAVSESGGAVHLSDFDPFSHLEPEHREALTALEAKVLQDEFTPPTLKELAALNPLYKELSKHLVESNRVFPIYDEKRTNLFFFHRDTVTNAVKKLRSAFPPPTEFRAGEAKDVLGMTRKYAMPLLGFLDKQKITRRNKDFRRLVQ